MKHTDHDLEQVIGRVLHVGVAVSTVCLAAGLVISLFATSPGLLILNIGIIVLIATPTARVVLSIVEYASARDWRFTILTTIVLLELVIGAVAAFVFHRRL